MIPAILDPKRPAQPFPDPNEALQEPDGLLAMGGCLSSERIINAYRHGIFPWFSNGEPIFWWSPDPRLVLFPQQLRISRSLRKTINRNIFHITFDQAFEQVIQACSEPRDYEHSTWITHGMITAYCELHQQGIAHSVEAWFGDNLVGGLYGLAIGRIFFGESMFHRKTDASKVAFAHLVKQLQQWDFALIDCQVRTEHLQSLGAKEISRREFISRLDEYCDMPVTDSAWINPA